MTNDSTAAAVANELPPYSLEAEQAVLGSCLIDREAIAAVAPVLAADDFWRAPHGIIYDAILRLWNRRVPADLIAVISELRKAPAIVGMPALDFCGGESYVAELILATPTAVHANFYAAIVKEYANRRRNVELAEQIARDAYDPELSEDDRVARATDAIRAMPTRAHQSVSMADLMNAWHDEPDGIRAVGFQTATGTYDAMTGGLRPGQLVTIGARTGIGKSALAGQWAYYLARAGHAVGFISLEMSKEQVSRRMVGQVVPVNISRAAMDATYYELHLSSIVQARGVLSELPIYVNDTFASDLPSVVGAIARYRETHNIKVAFLDYLGQMTNPTVKASNRAIELGSVTRALKLAALDLNICVVLLAQLNRGLEERGENATPRLSDLRDSGSTEQDSDVVLLLHRPKMDEPKTIFHVAKNREGAVGQFPMYFVDFRTRFEEPGGRL